MGTLMPSFADVGLSAATLLSFDHLFRDHLFRTTEIHRSLRRANAVRWIASLDARVRDGTLTSRSVQQERCGPKGIALQSQPHGAAVLGLIVGIASAGGGNWAGIDDAVQPALNDPLTRSIGLLLSGLAAEHLGRSHDADRCVEQLADQGDERHLTALCQLLLDFNFMQGIAALLERDGERLERSALRFIEIEKIARGHGLERLVSSTVHEYRTCLNGGGLQDISGPIEKTVAESLGGGWALSRRHKAAVYRSLSEYFAGVRKRAGERTATVVDDFLETVHLLSIENPFEMWRELGRLVSADWPEGLAAEEAVAQGRK